MTCISATLEQVARGLYQLNWYLSANSMRPDWDNEDQQVRRMYLHRAAMLGIIIHDGESSGAQAEDRADSLQADIHRPEASSAQ